MLRSESEISDIDNLKNKPLTLLASLTLADAIRSSAFGAESRDRYSTEVGYLGRGRGGRGGRKRYAIDTVSFPEEGEDGAW
jgi:hypothetical protein